MEGGLDIKLDKRIPVAAGMAGGSTDAASCMLAINDLYGLGLSKRHLMKRGVKLGADIPYCILKGTALSEGIGEELTPLPQIPQCQVLIAKPGISVSTKVVYESLDAMELKQEDHPDIDGMIEAINRQNIHEIAGKFGNVLELVTAGKYPVIGEIEQVMKEEGAVNAMMSGSGPTVFGIFDNRDKMAAAARSLRKSGLAKTVFATDIYNRDGGVTNDK